MKSHKAHFGCSTGGLLMTFLLITSFLLEGSQQQQQQHEEQQQQQQPPPSTTSSWSPRPPSWSPPSSSWSPRPSSSSSSWSPPSSSSWSPPSSSSWWSPSPPPSYPPSPRPTSSSSSPPTSSSSLSSSCVNQLLPCLNYITSSGNGGDSKLSDSCCDPLKEMIKSNPECLCNMISINGTREAEKAGINVTQAQQLPARCGQHVNPVACLTSTGSPGSKNSLSSSASSFSFHSQNFAHAVTVLMMSLAIFSCTS